jgi:hypothetical protein
LRSFISMLFIRFCTGSNIIAFQSQFYLSMNIMANIICTSDPQTAPRYQ